MYDDLLDVDYVDLINELQDVFGEMDVEFEQTALAPDTCAVFLLEDVVVRVGVSQQQIARAERASRPPRSRYSKELVEALLEDVQDVMTVTVEDGPGGSLNQAAKTDLCYAATRHLLNAEEASLVHWHASDTLFASDEFKLPATNEAFAASHLEVADTHERLDAEMMNVVRMDPAPLETQDMIQAMIDPERGEEDLRRARRRIFAGDLIEGSEPSREAPIERIGAGQQLVVYLMTTVVLLMSFPIGFVMLVYNLVRGEDLNLSARATALTGVGFGITQNPELIQALAFLA
ncbi:hypothetical protein ACMU_17940 [Actibacterium mucosum KCTC 23349]|uniref:Uncharacterized protein n=2 Tax=Actibacterium TaxID=1433986 RepID=A0A037ZG41_9RHOB|nr:hypothetical protein ACMU_17940 [Actibacterium mucosum KCTC 23349]